VVEETFRLPQLILFEYTFGCDSIAEYFVPGDTFELVFNKHSSYKLLKFWRYFIDLAIEAQLRLIQQINESRNRTFFIGTVTV
jgi:hypothetical protein